MHPALSVAITFAAKTATTAFTLYGVWLDDTVNLKCRVLWVVTFISSQSLWFYCDWMNCFDEYIRWNIISTGSFWYFNIRVVWIRPVSSLGCAPTNGIESAHLSTIKILFKLGLIKLVRRPIWSNVGVRMFEVQISLHTKAWLLDLLH